MKFKHLKSMGYALIMISGFLIGMSENPLTEMVAVIGLVTGSSVLVIYQIQKVITEAINNLYGGKHGKR